METGQKKYRNVGESGRREPSESRRAAAEKVQPLGGRHLQVGCLPSSAQLSAAGQAQPQTPGAPAGAAGTGTSLQLRGGSGRSGRPSVGQGGFCPARTRVPARAGAGICECVSKCHRGSHPASH